jgi:alpha-L-rhamnosidase
LNSNARWIWDSGAPQPRDHYLYFRKVIHLPGTTADTAAVEITADTHYKLYVNGDFIHHGPARSDPRHYCLDQYDIRRKLRPGENVIGVLVHFPGIGTCSALVGRGGLLFSAEITSGEETISVVSDDSWKIAPAPYVSGYDRMSVQLAYPEHFDATREPHDWNAPGFDDSAWEDATVLGPPGMEPWINLEPRDIPMQRTRTIAPVRLLQRNLVIKADPKLSTPAEDMECATRLQPAPAGAVTWSHPALFTIAPISGEQGTSVVLDFGKEVSGFPWLVIRPCGGGRIDIGYSERIEADGSVNPNRWGGCPVHYADRLDMRTGPHKWISFSPRAFRYLRLDFYDCPAPVEILMEMDTFGYPVEYRGDFQCSDPLLNKIWEVGRYTAELCMDDAYMDCPWRERGQWLADTRVEALVGYYAFGDWKLARRAWRQYAQSQATLDGFNGGVIPPEHHKQDWIKCVYPSSPPFDTVLPTFNCIWINGLWEYFLLTGDRELLTELWPNVDRLLKLLAVHESENGLLHNLPGWVFVDWAKLDVRGEAAHVNAFYYGAMLAAAKIARAVGRPEQGGDLEMRATDVKDSLNDLLWDNAQGLYRDGRVGEELSETVSEQANILCVLYGIADRLQTERILSALYGTENTNIIRIATPYFSFYLLRALYSMGRHSQALDYMRTHWGAMLNRGATTFWEYYEPEYSLCHAWSAAPTYDLPAEIAGIRPLQPGFEEFTVEPQPGNLTWLKAIVPTVRGDITFSYHSRTDKPFIDSAGHEIKPAHSSPAITINLTIPLGTRAHLRLPLQDIAEPTVLLNGKTIWDAGKPVESIGEKFKREGDRLVVGIAIPGTYHFEIDCPR